MSTTAREARDGRAAPSHGRRIPELGFHSGLHQRDARLGGDLGPPIRIASWASGRIRPPTNRTAWKFPPSSARATSGMRKGAIDRLNADTAVRRSGRCQRALFDDDLRTKHKTAATRATTRIVEGSRRSIATRCIGVSCVPGILQQLLVPLPRVGQTRSLPHSRESRRRPVRQPITSL